MYGDLKNQLKAELYEIRAAGLYKGERVIDTPQAARVSVGERSVLNMCANNYLGLASHPEVIEAARDALDEWGYGLASVRFICGTQAIHKQLEDKLSDFLGMEDTILYTSCFDANGGLFETLLGPNDAVISDELNHASIIDGVRLCKAKRFRYKNNDMTDLAAQLEAAKGARRILIVTDGVFSMDGYLANLPAICDLADAQGALVMVDDSHAVGFMGARGRGTHEHHGVMDRIDIITGTLGKALGGASGGYTSGRAEIIEYLRQRSRPYLFPTPLRPASLPPPSRPSSCSTPRPTCAIAWRPTQNYSANKWPAAAFTFLKARIRSRPSCSATPPSPAALPTPCSKRASTSSAFPTPSCPRARPASARKSRPPTRGRISNSLSPNLARRRLS